MPVGAFSPCIAKNGMVATMNPFATEAGLHILREGGNAVDAAITIATVMNVVDPRTSGIGGDAFMLIYDSKSKSVKGVNGSGVAPYATSVEQLKKLDMQQMPTNGIHSVSVPGAVDAYATALDLYGTMPLQKLLAPAISFAEEGVLMGARDRRDLFDRAKEFGDGFSGLMNLLCTGAFISDRIGTLTNKDLGKSLRLIAEDGRDAFYTGDIARAIVACSQEHGGFFTLREFEDHRSTVYDPISTNYRGHTIYETAPPSQGHIVLQSLNIVEGFDLQAMGYNSVDAIHHMAEAVKLAFADRLAYAGDSDFVEMPIDTLISKDFAVQRREQIDPQRASEKISVGNLLRAGDTTSFAVADKEGNAVSCITSLASALGSGVVVDGTGIILNNRAHYFFFDADHPNRLEPGRCTRSTPIWPVAATSCFSWVIRRAAICSRN